MLLILIVLGLLGRSAHAQPVSDKKAKEGFTLGVMYSVCFLYYEKVLNEQQAVQYFRRLRSEDIFSYFLPELTETPNKLQKKSDEDDCPVYALFE